MEYPRASIQAENGRLNVSIPCWYVVFAWASCCCCCWAVACAACCLDALLALRCLAPPTIVPAVAPAAAPLPASSSAIAPIAAPPAAPLAAPFTRPPFACLALSAAACCSAFFCSSVLAAGGGACGSIPDCCLAEAKHSFSSFTCWSALCWFFGYAYKPTLLAGEDAPPDCCAVVVAGVGLFAGRDWASTGVAKQNVANMSRCITIECLLSGPASGLADAGPLRPCTYSKLMMNCDCITVP